MKNKILKKISEKCLIILMSFSVALGSCEKIEEKPKDFPPVQPCSGTPFVEYFGQTYGTVQIGDQCWMERNLDVGSFITSNSSPTDNDTIEKYCYNNDTSNCRKFGGLYVWDELMQYNEGVGAQGICPPGWHIPTDDEYVALTFYTDNYAPYIIDKNEYWDSYNPETTLPYNLTGFSAIPSGYYSVPFQVFGGLGNSAFFWKSELDISDLIIEDNSIYYGQKSLNYAFPVRCIKDQ